MYDKPNRQRYGFGQVNAASGSTYRLKGPRGKAGRVHDVGFDDVTIGFTAVTTDAKVSVGTAGSPALFAGPLSMGAIAAPSGGKSIRTSAQSAADRDAAIPNKIPADTEVVVTVTAPTGGTPAGTGRLFVIIDWDD